MKLRYIKWSKWTQGIYFSSRFVSFDFVIRRNHR